MAELVTDLQESIRVKDELIADAAELIAHLRGQLKRCKLKRPKISATQSTWIAGRQSFRCAAPHGKDLCPRFHMSDGTFDEVGWEVDHIDGWSESFDHRSSKLRALCATCHSRCTKMQMVDRFDGDDEEEVE